MDSDMRYKVLMADDDEIVQLLGQTALEESGFELNIATDGNEVLPKYESFKPDIVILDVNMPGKDGITLCSEIRSTTHGKLIPILMITGLDDLNAINRCLEAGATDFESKPVNWLILGQKIRFLINSSDLYRKHAKDLIMNHDEDDSGPDFFTDYTNDESLDLRIIDNIKILEQETEKKVLVELIENFKQEIPSFIQKIQHANQQKDYKSLQSYLFYVRTKCGNIGALKMTQICKEIDRLLANQSYDILDELIVDLQTEYETVLNQLHQIKIS